MRLYDLLEDGDTSAGSMAVAVMPIGTMQRRIPRKKKTIKEAPIQPNLDEPTNPDIYGTKANPSNLNSRRLRAMGQLKELSKRAESAEQHNSLEMWESIVADFKELTMNIGEIDHAINELRALRKRGGMYSRGIPKL